MTQMEPSRTPELREDAAMWFALMRGPEAQAQRAHFEAWLAADPAHRAAYSHISDLFRLGKGLALSADIADTGLSAASHRPMMLARVTGSPVFMLLLLLVSVPLLVGLTMAAMRSIHSDHPFVQASGQERAPGGAASLATASGEVRSFTLADGSRVTLDADSRVRVMLSPKRRDLALLRGRARFFVAHEPRPFVVAAGGGSILARGTIFDVALRDHAGASVALIEGLVEVRQPHAVGAAAGEMAQGGAVTRLTPGQALAIGEAHGGAPRVTPSPPTDWPRDVRDFRDVPLRELLAEANRYADTPLALAQPALGDLRVSGTFRVREPARLAGNLAALLDLTLIESPSGIVLARRCPTREINSCPPS